MLAHLLSIAAQLWPHIQTLREQVSDAMADGEGISAQEARDLGFALAEELGDLRISIRGRDVLRRQAQRELFGAAGRICRQIAISLGEDR